MAMRTLGTIWLDEQGQRQELIGRNNQGFYAVALLYDPYDPVDKVQVLHKTAIRRRQWRLRVKAKGMPGDKCPDCGGLWITHRTRIDYLCPFCRATLEASMRGP